MHKNDQIRDIYSIAVLSCYNPGCTSEEGDIKCFHVMPIQAQDCDSIPDNSYIMVIVEKVLHAY